MVKQQTSRSRSHPCFDDRHRGRHHGQCTAHLAVTTTEKTGRADENGKNFSRHDADYAPYPLNTRLQPYCPLQTLFKRLRIRWEATWLFAHLPCLNLQTHSFLQWIQNHLKARLRLLSFPVRREKRGCSRIGILFFCLQGQSLAQTIRSPVFRTCFVRL